MKALRDYLCEQCGVEEERYIDSAITHLVCDHCGGTMQRLIGMPRVALDGTDPGFPGAYSKWATTREDNARIKAKRSWKQP
jgi:hypothetical protein